MKTIVTLLMFAVLAVSQPMGNAPHAGDTTADCGRFYLKYDPQTKQMKCVGDSKRKRKEGPNVAQLSRALQTEVRRLQRALDGAEALLRSREVNQQTEQRIQQLLVEARQRTQEVRQRTQELVQAQRQRNQQLETSQRQATQAQIQLANQLEQRQRTLTQQLLAEQRGRQQLLRARPTGQ